VKRGLAAMALLAGLGWQAAWAGRPLAVEDAGVNDAGHGHLEAWAARGSGGAREWNLAPAYAPMAGLELAATLTRETREPLSSAALQAKWQLSPSRDAGCNAALVLGATRSRGVPGNGHYLTGVLSCNALGPGSAHLNLGRAKDPGAASAATWGLAYELPVGGVTPHVEWFGRQGERATVQVGARADVATGVQLDASLGRGNGDTLLTLGFKLQF
jgi:hypothetical protein